MGFFMHEYPKGNRYGWFWRLEIWRLIGVLKIGEKIWGISCGVCRDLGYMASIKIYKLNLGRIKGNNGNLCGISSSSIGAIKESILSMSESAEPTSPLFTRPGYSQYHQKLQMGNSVITYTKHALMCTSIVMKDVCGYNACVQEHDYSVYRCE